MRQVNERTQKPVDHDLHAGRRRRHDRLGADRDPANQSGARARGSGRRKMTNREGGSHAAAEAIETAAAEATEAASAAARRITTRHTDTSRRARPLWKSGSSLRRKRLLDGFAGVVDLLVAERERADVNGVHLGIPPSITCHPNQSHSSCRRLLSSCRMTTRPDLVSLARNAVSCGSRWI
jgi:hypothetical protein